MENYVKSQNGKWIKKSNLPNAVSAREKLEQNKWLSQHNKMVNNSWRKKTRRNRKASRKNRKASRKANRR